MHLCLCCEWWPLKKHSGMDWRGFLFSFVLFLQTLQTNMKIHFKGANIRPVHHVLTRYLESSAVWRLRISGCTSRNGSVAEIWDAIAARILRLYLVVFLLRRGKATRFPESGHWSTLKGDKAMMSGCFTHLGDWWPRSDPERLMSSSVGFFFSAVLTKYYIVP